MPVFFVVFVVFSLYCLSLNNSTTSFRKMFLFFVFFLFLNSLRLSALIISISIFKDADFYLPLHCPFRLLLSQQGAN